MNSQRSPLRSASSPTRFLRPVAVTLLALCGGASVLALADSTTTQPDPPVPLESPAQKVAFAQRNVQGDLDCRCAVLHARDMESRIEGHVERFEALSAAPSPEIADPGHARDVHLAHLASYVEGVVGFPVRDFRLADDADDAAGSD